MADLEVAVNNNPSTTWLYGRLNCYADLTSNCILSVPSLRLTEEFFDYMGNQIIVEDENASKIGNQMFVSRVDVIPSSEQCTLDVNEVYDQIQTVPDFYYFANVDVSLFGADSLYEDTIRFRKCSLHYSYQACAKLNIFNRSLYSVAFKILCNKPEETRAEPSIGVVHSRHDQRLMIYLKTLNDEHVDRLMFKIQIAQLDDHSDPKTVWHNPNAIISCTPKLRCVLVQDDDSATNQNKHESKPENSMTSDEIAEDQIITDTYGKPKRQRFRLFRHNFSRSIARAWRRLRNKPKKEKM